MYVWSCHDINGLRFCSNYRVEIKINHHIYLLRLEDIVPLAPTYPFDFFMWRTEKLIYEILESIEAIFQIFVYKYLYKGYTSNSICHNR